MASDITCGILFLALALVIWGLVREKKQVRRESLDDDIPGFDDWRFGTPDDPLPDEAQSLDGAGKNPKNNVLSGGWKGEED